MSLKMLNVKCTLTVEFYDNCKDFWRLTIQTDFFFILMRTIDIANVALIVRWSNVKSIF